MVLRHSTVKIKLVSDIQLDEPDRNRMIMNENLTKRCAINLIRMPHGLKFLVLKWINMKYNPG